MNPLLKNLKTSFVDPFKKVMSSPLPAMGGNTPVVKPTTLNTNSSGMVSTPAIPNMSYAPTPSMTMAQNPTSMTGTGAIGPVVPAIPSTSQGGDPNVRAQQIALNANGAGLKVDGILGPLTMAAIKARDSAVVKTPDGGIINPNTGGVTKNETVPPPVAPAAPVAPTSPAVPSIYENNVTAAEKAYTTAGQMTPEEEAAQAELDRLSSSFKTGYQGIEDKTIPLEFITGQKASLEKRALNLAEPLQTKLARLQAQRTSALETSKFALERADAKLKTQTDAEKEKGKLLEGTSFYDPKTKTWQVAPAKTATPDGFSLSPGQTRFDANGNPIATVADPNAPGATQNTQKSMDQINLVKSSLQRAKDLAGASGRSGVRKTAESWFIGSTDYTNLIAETNTLRTNVLTLMTDPTIKKFFGPQMSNADVQLMTSAGTTLNPELQSADNMRSELTRLTDLIERAEKAVQQGVGGGESDTSGTGGGLYDF